VVPARAVPPARPLGVGGVRVPARLRARHRSIVGGMCPPTVLAPGPGGAQPATTPASSRANASSVTTGTP
jgi:hypothetical protein